MKRKALSAFTLGLIFSNASMAINLGDIEVSSNFREPFNAVIPVLNETSSKNIEVMMAEKYAFLNSRINRQAALDLINVSIVQDEAGQYYVSLNSNEPVNELFLELIVDITADKEKLSKGYTVLLDPVNHQIKLRPVARKLTKVEKPKPKVKESHSMESSTGEDSHDMKGSFEESHSMESSIGEDSHDMKGSFEESHSMESSIGEDSHDMKGSFEESHSMESSIGEDSHDMKGSFEESHSMESSVGNVSQGM